MQEHYKQMGDIVGAHTKPHQTQKTSDYLGVSGHFRKVGT